MYSSLFFKMSSPQKYAYSTISLIAFMAIVLCNQSFASTSCEQLMESTVFNWVIRKISNSDVATANNISCDELREIESYEEDLLIITTGRRRGNYVICISNDKEYPCKHTIATLSGSSTPNKMLEDVFSYKAEKSTQLNETVERLYLKPSSLIR